VRLLFLVVQFLCFIPLLASSFYSLICCHQVIDRSLHNDYITNRKTFLMDYPAVSFLMLELVQARCGGSTTNRGRNRICSQCTICVSLRVFYALDESISGSVTSVRALMFFGLTIRAFQKQAYMSVFRVPTNLLLECSCASEVCTNLNTMLPYVLPGTCTSVFVSILGLLRDPLPPTSYILLACFSCNVDPLLVSFSRTGSRLPPRPRVSCPAGLLWLRRCPRHRRPRLPYRHCPHPPSDSMP
jgi:hypothetical protein